MKILVNSCIRELNRLGMRESRYSRILISARIRWINAVALTDFALIEQSNQYEKNNLVHTSDFEKCAKPPWRALPDRLEAKSEKGPRNHFREDGMLACVIHAK